MVLVWICNEALMKYMHKKVFHLLSKGYWYAGWINWRRNSSLLHALIIDIKVHSGWMNSYRFKCLMKCLFSIFFLFALPCIWCVGASVWYATSASDGHVCTRAPSIQNFLSISCNFIETNTNFTSIFKQFRFLENCKC